MAAAEQEQDEVRRELESEKAKNGDGRKAELIAKDAEKDALLAKVKEMREKASEIEEVTREMQRVSDGRPLTLVQTFTQCICSHAISKHATSTININQYHVQKSEKLLRDWSRLSPASHFLQALEGDN